MESNIKPDVFEFNNNAIEVRQLTISVCSEINYAFMLVILCANCVEKPRYSGAMPTFFALLSHKLTSPTL